MFDLDPGLERFSELRLALKLSQQAGKRNMALPMDGVILESEQATAVPRLGRPKLRSPAMPPETPLAMPVQSLYRFSRRSSGAWVDPARRRTPWVARLFAFGGGLALTAYGARRCTASSRSASITLLEWALVVLFVTNFSWIALAFTSSVRRLFLAAVRRAEVRRRCPTGLARRAPPSSCRSTTRRRRGFSARVAGDLRGCRRATGLGDAFDYFFLSDTTDPDVWIAEERALLALRERLAGRAPLLSPPARRTRAARPAISPISSPAGAAPIEHMVVLDADSLMTGDAIVRLAAAMEGDPDAGIIQTLPLIINRNTLFARVQQFAARISWPGHRRRPDAPGWAATAITGATTRSSAPRAFAAHCGLPDLPRQAAVRRPYPQP